MQAETEGEREAEAAGSGRSQEEQQAATVAEGRVRLHGRPMDVLVGVAHYTMDSLMCFWCPAQWFDLVSCGSYYLDR